MRLILVVVAWSRAGLNLWGIVDATTSISPSLAEYWFLESECYQNSFKDAYHRAYASDYSYNGDCLPYNSIDSVASSWTSSQFFSKYTNPNDLTFEFWMQINSNQGYSILRVANSTNAIMYDLEISTAYTSNDSNLGLTVSFFDENTIQGIKFKFPYKQGIQTHLRHFILSLSFSESLISRTIVYLARCNLTVDGIYINTVENLQTTRSFSPKFWTSNHMYLLRDNLNGLNTTAPLIMHYFAIHNRTLTDDEINYKYNYGLPFSAPDVYDNQTIINENGEIGDHTQDPYYYTVTIPSTDLAYVNFTIYNFDDTSISPNYDPLTVPNTVVVLKAVSPSTDICTLYYMNGTRIPALSDNTSSSFSSYTYAYIPYNTLTQSHSVRVRPGNNLYSMSTPLCSITYGAMDSRSGMMSVYDAELSIFVQPVKKPPTTYNQTTSMAYANSLIIITLGGIKGDNDLYGGHILSYPLNGDLYSVDEDGNLLSTDPIPSWNTTSTSTTSNSNSQESYYINMTIPKIGYRYKGSQYVTRADTFTGYLYTDYFEFSIQDNTPRSSIVAIYNISIYSALTGSIFQSASIHDHEFGGVYPNKAICHEDEMSPIIIQGYDHSIEARNVSVLITNVPIYGTLYYAAVSSSSATTTTTTSPMSSASSSSSSSIRSYNSQIQAQVQYIPLQIGSILPISISYPYTNDITIYYQGDPNYFNYPNTAYDGSHIDLPLDTFQFCTFVHTTTTTTTIHNSSSSTTTTGNTIQVIDIYNMNQMIISSSETVSLIVQNFNQPTYIYMDLQSPFVNNQALLYSYEADPTKYKNKITVKGFKLYDLDMGISLVKASVATKYIGGYITLNPDYLNQVSFNSLDNCIMDTSLFCTGNGQDDSVSVFVGTPEAVENALNGMTYYSRRSNIQDEITVTIYDGQGDNCISDSAQSTESIRTTCYNTNNVTFYVTTVQAANAAAQLGAVDGRIQIILIAAYIVGLIICLRCCCCCCCPRKKQVKKSTTTTYSEDEFDKNSSKHDTTRTEMETGMSIDIYDTLDNGSSGGSSGGGGDSYLYTKTKAYLQKTKKPKSLYRFICCLPFYISSFMCNMTYRWIKNGMIELFMLPVSWKSPDPCDPSADESSSSSFPTTSARMNQHPNLYTTTSNDNLIHPNKQLFKRQLNTTTTTTAGTVTAPTVTTSYLYEPDSTVSTNTATATTTKKYTETNPPLTPADMNTIDTLKRKELISKAKRLREQKLLSENGEVNQRIKQRQMQFMYDMNSIESMRVYDQNRMKNQRCTDDFYEDYHSNLPNKYNIQNNNDKLYKRYEYDNDEDSEEDKNNIDENDNYFYRHQPPSKPNRLPSTNYSSYHNNEERKAWEPLYKYTDTSSTTATTHPADHLPPNMDPAREDLRSIIYRDLQQGNILNTSTQDTSILRQSREEYTANTTQPVTTATTATTVIDNITNHPNTINTTTTTASNNSNHVFYPIRQSWERVATIFSDWSSPPPSQDAKLTSTSNDANQTNTSIDSIAFRYTVDEPQSRNMNITSSSSPSPSRITQQPSSSMPSSPPPKPPPPPRQSPSSTTTTARMSNTRPTTAVDVEPMSPLTSLVYERSYMPPRRTTHTVQSIQSQGIPLHIPNQYNNRYLNQSIYTPPPPPPPPPSRPPPSPLITPLTTTDSVATNILPNNTSTNTSMSARYQLQIPETPRTQISTAPLIRTPSEYSTDTTSANRRLVGNEHKNDSNSNSNDVALPPRPQKPPRVFSPIGSNTSTYTYEDDKNTVNQGTRTDTTNQSIYFDRRNRDSGNNMEITPTRLEHDMIQTQIQSRSQIQSHPLRPPSMRPLPGLSMAHMNNNNNNNNNNLYNSHNSTISMISVDSSSNSSRRIVTSPPHHPTSTSPTTSSSLSAFEPIRMSTRAMTSGSTNTTHTSPIPPPPPRSPPHPQSPNSHPPPPPRRSKHI